MSPGNRIRIGQFTPRIVRGGIEGRVGRILAGLPRDEFEPSWFAFAEVDQRLLESAGPGVDPAIFSKRTVRTGVDFDLLRRVALEMKTRRLDVMHVHNWSTSFYGIVGARLAGVRGVLYGYGGRESPDRPSAKQIAVMRALGPHVDRVTTVCQSLGDELVSDWGVSSEIVHVIPTGVNIASILAARDRSAARSDLGIAEDAVVVGCVGGVRPIKRVEDLFDAVSILYTEGGAIPPIHVLLVGAHVGVDPDDLRARARRGGFASRLSMPGEIDDVTRVILALDVLVNCSSFEGASNAIIEGMVAGLPVVGTRVGGTPELIQDGETGFVVASRDPVALAAALRTLVKNADLRRTFGAAGKAIALVRHAPEKMIAAHLELYRALARAPRPTPLRRVYAGTRGMVRGLGARLGIG